MNRNATIVVPSHVPLCGESGRQIEALGSNTIESLPVRSKMFQVSMILIMIVVFVYMELRDSKYYKPGNVDLHQQ